MDASDYQALIRISVTLLVGMLSLVLIISLVKWRMASGGNVKGESESERLQLEMKALAAQKIRERGENPSGTNTSSEEAAVHDEDDDGFMEGEPL